MFIFSHSTTSDEKTCEDLTEKMSTIPNLVKMQSKDELRGRRSCQQLQSEHQQGKQTTYGADRGRPEKSLRATKSQASPTDKKDQSRPHHGEGDAKKRSKRTMKRQDKEIPISRISSGVSQPPLTDADLLDEDSELFSSDNSSEKKSLHRVSLASEGLSKNIEKCYKVTRDLKEDSTFAIIFLIFMLITKLIFDYCNGNSRNPIWIIEMKETVRRYLTQSERWEYYWGTRVGKFFEQAMAVASSNLYW